MKQENLIFNLEFQNWKKTPDPGYLIWAYFDDDTIYSNFSMCVNRFWYEIKKVIERHPIHFTVFRLDMSKKLRSKYQDFESLYRDLLENPTLLTILFFGTTLKKEEDRIGQWDNIIRFKNWREMKSAILKLNVSKNGKQRNRYLQI